MNSYYFSFLQSSYTIHTARAEEVRNQLDYILCGEFRAIDTQIEKNKI